jgi:hypothetical protein
MDPYTADALTSEARRETIASLPCRQKSHNGDAGDALG